MIIAGEAGADAEFLFILSVGSGIGFGILGIYSFPDFVQVGVPGGHEGSGSSSTYLIVLIWLHFVLPTAAQRFVK